MESDSDIDKSERQAESDSNEFQGNSAASFEWPMQNSSYFEPLYPGANIAKCGAYYTIMLYANKFKISNKAIHGLTKLLHLFCPSPNSLPKSEYVTFFKQFYVPYKHQTVCNTCGVKNSAVLV